MGGRGEVEEVLRKMLRELFEADCRGARREKLARAHGYADGYMRALLDLEIVSQKELLDMVLDERRRVARGGAMTRREVFPGTARSQVGEALA